jgi:hypothetical protein
LIKKFEKKNHPRHCRYRQCPGASISFTKTCKHDSIKMLLGLMQWLQSEKLKKIKIQSRHCLQRQCPGASNSFTKSRKYESINQLLGLVQWLETEKKVSKKTQPRYFLH